MKQERIINIVTAALFSAFVLIFSLLFFILPDKTVSGTERRNLQQSPELTWDSLSDGTFSSKINDYFNDQFPARESFLGVKTLFERLLLKRENNGVLFGDNGQLAVRLFQATDGQIHTDQNGDLIATPYTDRFYESVVSAQFDAIKTLESALKEKGVELYVIMPPRTVDVACSAFAYPKENSDALIKCVRENAQGLEYFIDLYDIFRARYDNGEYVYYRTDHHWTTLGAYYAYEELCKAMGIDKHGIPEFNVKTAATDFVGTTASKAGLLNADADTIEYWTAKDGSNTKITMRVTNNNSGAGGSEYDSMFDMTYLEDYDKYGMFLSGTNKFTEIAHRSASPYKKILVLKDSFGHSLVPFLACEYDVTVIELANLNEIKIDPAKYEAVVICYNLENLITSTNLSRLKYVPKLVD
ncbi:MAG: hypothetical protein J5760_01195 [Clostridia bacterium]|nr:hypothetical protein [Clostridia bacterium]